MAHRVQGSVALPVAGPQARAGLRAAVEDHELVDVRRSDVDLVDVVIRARERRGEARVRFTVCEGVDGTSVVEHGSWGLWGLGSEELYAAVVADATTRLRAAVARGLLAGPVAVTGTATGAHVGTLVGGRGLGLRPGATLAVVFGPDGLRLLHGTTSFTLEADELLEVEALPVTTPGIGWDEAVLAAAVADASVGTVVGIAATTGLECLLHVAGSTTSVVGAELARVRAASRPHGPDRPRPSPADQVAEPRPGAGGKRSPITLVREMAVLAQRHHDGVLDDDEFAHAKAELLGTASG